MDTYGKELILDLKHCNSALFNRVSLTVFSQNCVSELTWNNVIFTSGTMLESPRMNARLIRI